MSDPLLRFDPWKHLLHVATIDFDSDLYNKSRLSRGPKEKLELSLENIKEFKGPFLNKKRNYVYYHAIMKDGTRPSISANTYEALVSKKIIDRCPDK